MAETVVVLDSNIWISYFLNKDTERLVAVSEKHNLVFVSCEQLVFELNDVLSRQKFRKYFSNDALAEFRVFHLKLSQQLKVQKGKNYFTDKKDDFLMHLALQSWASYLVTGDKEILESGIKPPPEIINKSAFERIFPVKK